MPRPEKVQAVAEIKERIEGAEAVFLAEYAGLSVQDQQTLRRALKKGGAEFKVVKMTLARRAAADLDIDSLDELLLGPTGLAFADGDVVTAAKALRDFAKDHEVFAIKGGLLGDDFLTPERINALADIESREVLLAKILGAMQAPMSNLAGLVAALPRGFATALQQLIDKAPEPAVAADEAAVDEAAVDEAADDEPAAEAAEAEAEEAPAAEASDDEPATEEKSDEDSDEEPAAEDEPEAEPEAEADDEPEASADAEESDDAEDDGADEAADGDAGDESDEEPETEDETDTDTDDPAEKAEEE